MLRELYTAALSMQNQLTKLEVTSNNMANANTTGFKSATAFERNLIDARANFYNTPGDVEQNDPPIGSYYDFTMGAFHKTGNSLDLAIDEKGFFVLQDEEGKEFLTRSGSFSLAKDGSLIARDGKKLMGEGGPLRVDGEFFADSLETGDSDALDVRIAQSGEVFVNDYEIGKILLADTENYQSLQRISDTQFIATFDSEINYVDSDKVNVRQGWLEESNVNIVSEMVSMIELQRSFEAGSKVIKTNDETLDNSIRLGKYY